MGTGGWDARWDPRPRSARGTAVPNHAQPNRQVPPQAPSRGLHPFQERSHKWGFFPLGEKQNPTLLLSPLPFALRLDVVKDLNRKAMTEPIQTPLLF